MAERGYAEDNRRYKLAKIAQRLPIITDLQNVSPIAYDMAIHLLDNYPTVSDEQMPRFAAAIEAAELHLSPKDLQNSVQVERGIKSARTALETARQQTRRNKQQHRRA